MSAKKATCSQKEAGIRGCTVTSKRLSSNKSTKALAFLILRHSLSSLMRHGRPIKIISHLGYSIPMDLIHVSSEGVQVHVPLGADGRRALHMVVQFQ
eukprot:scaffold106817_cov51-Attheya_sp.AAC.3